MKLTARKYVNTFIPGVLENIISFGRLNLNRQHDYPFFQPAFDISPITHHKLSGVLFLSTFNQAGLAKLSLTFAFTSSSTQQLFEIRSPARYEPSQDVPNITQKYSGLQTISSSGNLIDVVIQSPLEPQQEPSPPAPVTPLRQPSQLSFAPFNRPFPVRRKRKPRKKPVQSPWELHYRYLTKLILPYHFIHRCDPSYHSLWQHLSRQKDHRYVRDRLRCRSQNVRLAFIAVRRKQLAREKHEVHRQRKLRQRIRQRLYRMAYLRFKKGRIELFQRLRRLRIVYRLGWTACREWLAWRGIIQPSNLPRRRKRRVHRGTDEEINLEAERRIMELFRYPGIKSRAKRA